MKARERVRTGRTRSLVFFSGQSGRRKAFFGRRCGRRRGLFLKVRVGGTNAMRRAVLPGASPEGRPDAFSEERRRTAGHCAEDLFAAGDRTCACGRICRSFRPPDGSEKNRVGRRCCRRAGGSPDDAAAQAEGMSFRSPARQVAGIRARNESFGKNGAGGRGRFAAGRSGFLDVGGFIAGALRTVVDRCLFRSKAGQVFGACRSAFYRMTATSDILQRVDRQRSECGGWSGPHAGRPGRPDSGERKRGSVGRGGHPPVDEPDVLAFRENCSNFPRSPRCPPDGDPFGMRLSGSEVGGSDLYT